MQPVAETIFQDTAVDHLGAAGTADQALQRGGASQVVLKGRLGAALQGLNQELPHDLQTLASTAFRSCSRSSKSEAVKYLGTKSKFWYRHGDRQMLFKAEKCGTDEDWAEKNCLRALRAAGFSACRLRHGDGH